MKVLITGGCGFLGSNLAEQLLAEKTTLLILDNLSRIGSEKNLRWLQSLGEFHFERCDIRDNDGVAKIVKNFHPDAVFHLAGQVAMTTSLAAPRDDFEINTVGTINLLEAIRQYHATAIIVYSSTNKVYGDLEWIKYDETDLRYLAPDFPDGFAEDLNLAFSSPYGCSKGAADQYVLDYAKTFGIRGVVFRHSSMYGGRQFSTYDQGWVGWFCQQALLQKKNKLSTPFSISGNGKQVRDLLHADDMKNLYFSAIKHIDRAAGQAFNIGGGIGNSLSLLELFGWLENTLDVKLRYHQVSPRASDQKFFVASTEKARHLLHWTPKINYQVGIPNLLDWIENNAS